MTAAARGNLTDALVYSYLKKRGFSDAAAALPQEARLLSDAQLQRHFPDMESAMQNRVTLFQGGEDYAASYARLRDWVYGSLDLYKARACAWGSAHAAARCVLATPP